MMSNFSKTINLLKLSRIDHSECFDVKIEDLKKIADVLGLLEIKSFRIMYRVDAPENGAYTLHGSINASVVQESVISLKPVTSAISDQFVLKVFASKKRMEEYENNLDDDKYDYDLHDKNCYDIGKVATEYLALSLPTYPRLKGE